jgi:hypothetical protein
VRWRGPGSLEFVAEADLAAGELTPLGRWPAGRSTFEVDGSEPKSIDLGAGESREVALTRVE